MQIRAGLRTNTWCMATRRPLIAGNWKMNPETVSEAIQLGKEISDAAKTSTAQVSDLSAIFGSWRHSVRPALGQSNEMIARKEHDCPETHV